MACLALVGIGAGMDDIAPFAAAYRVKLVPMAAADSVLSVDTWEHHLGKAASYAGLLSFFDAQIAAQGWPATVARFLPRLISGWVRDAFHPLIRLGYGIEFEVPSEIAAGLAYLTVAGDDPALARLARATPMAQGGGDYLASWQAHRQPAYSQGRFGTRYALVVDHAPLRPASNDTSEAWRALCDASLQVFHATHDFFALHMVTASHAWRVCAPYAGDEAPAIGSIGLATAYLAIGAPHFAPVSELQVSLPLADLLRATDEHDIKIAHSCLVQTRTFADPTYASVAAAYLAPHLA